MNPLLSFLTSSIGKKWIVAITGLVLVGYVIGHLIGNLQIFLGQETLNSYAHKLHAMGGLLWVVRIFLLTMFVLHIVTTIRLAIQNRKSRPSRYAYNNRVQATLAARTMAISGLIVLCFVIYHLLHFTAQTTNPEFRLLKDAQGEPDVYSMIILGFQNPIAAFFYLLGVFLLCMHLSHGFSSFLQTLGLNSQKVMTNLSIGGRILAWLIFAGYASIPLAVLFNILKLPTPL